MKELTELVELAKKATPGKWWIDSHGHTMVAFSGEAGDVEVVFATDNNMGPLVRHGDTGNLSHWRNDNDATFIAAANPATILAIADAFRALEQRTEAAEAKLTEQSNQNPVGKFCFEHCGKRWHHIKHGEAQFREPKLPMVPLFGLPAPAINLAELVPDEMTSKQASRSYGGEVAGYRDGFNACRSAMLKNIEEAK